jgi:hypothetical protein
MAQQKPEPTTIDEIVQLIGALPSVEHDHVVHELTELWGKPDQRQPWDRDKLVTADRQDKVAQVSRRVRALADTLTPHEQDELLEELKLVWIRRAVRDGEESARKHGTIPAEQVLNRLEAKYKRIKAEQ